MGVISATLTLAAFPSRAAAQRAVATGENATADARLLERLLAHPVDINVTEASLSRAVNAAAASADVLIQYDAQLLSAYTTPVTIHAKHLPLGLVLSRILSGTSLQVIADGPAKLGIVRTAPSVATMSGIITGTVVDAVTKRPVPDVSITLDEDTRHLQTGVDGTFTIPSATAGTHRLTVRRIGYARQQQVVTVTDDHTTTVQFALEPRTVALDQVVVTGTVVATALKAVPNAITVITAKELEQRGITHLDQLFHGDIPGLWAQEQGTRGLQPGQVLMASRGATSFAGALVQPIKTYVDGVELADPSYLGLIDPMSIERIEILTGPQASTIYGSNAINGVMQVFTKRGTTSRPQLTLNLESGLVENNFSAARTPQHDDAVQLSGIDGHLSYNAGGSWTYVGPWSPAVHTQTLSGFGGVRMQQGPVTADVSLRRTLGTNHEHGSMYQSLVDGTANGAYALNAYVTAPEIRTYRSTAQTIGVTITHALQPWWSHTVTLGTDVIDGGFQETVPGFANPSDTMLRLYQTTSSRTSVSYVTTVQLTHLSVMSATVTGGVDGWHSLQSSLLVVPTTLTGTLNASEYTVDRQPSHDHGAFAQGQVGVFDQLFLTYGFRAEWNPDYGKQANPNLVPRYGLAYTRDLGLVTAKLRASYGHSTRPPTTGLTQQITTCALNPRACSRITTRYGENVIAQAANPTLVPEQQQGGEGGLELYLGAAASLIVTRFNQTVDNLITVANVDSVDLLPQYRAALGIDPWTWGYYRWTTENLNLGSIRNQGWEAQGSFTTGPFTTKGTYSWTKSRIIGITPKYRAQFPQYTPGAVFGLMPEHTYAISIRYAHRNTTMSWDMQGQGLRYMNGIGGIGVPTALERAQSSTRLGANGAPIYIYQPDIGRQHGYMLSDLNASQRFSNAIEGIVQIMNLTNSYDALVSPDFAAMGRQTKVGVRIRY